MPNILCGDEIDIEIQNFETDKFEVCDYVMDGNGNIVSNIILMRFFNMSRGLFTFKDSIFIICK